MKTLLLVSIFVLSVIQPAQAQTDSLNIKKTYRTWIIPKDSRTGKILKERGNFLQGILFDVKDSSIIISKSMKYPDYGVGNFKASDVDAGMIKEVKIRKKGAMGTGVLIGGLTGSCIGILVGVLQHTNGGTYFDQETQHAGLIVFPLLFAGLGVGIGAAIGGMTLKFPIRGSQAQFDHYKDKLKTYSIKDKSELVE
jgi:hypothetical protein